MNHRDFNTYLPWDLGLWQLCVWITTSPWRSLYLSSVLYRHSFFFLSLSPSTLTTTWHHHHKLYLHGLSHSASNPTRPSPSASSSLASMTSLFHHYLQLQIMCISSAISKPHPLWQQVLLELILCVSSSVVLLSEFGLFMVKLKNNTWNMVFELLNTIYFFVGGNSFFYFIFCSWEFWKDFCSWGKMGPTFFVMVKEKKMGPSFFVMVKEKV